MKSLSQGMPKIASRSPEARKEEGRIPLQVSDTLADKTQALSLFLYPLLKIFYHSRNLDELRTKKRSQRPREWDLGDVHQGWGGGWGSMDSPILWRSYFWREKGFGPTWYLDSGRKLAHTKPEGATSYKLWSRVLVVKGGLSWATLESTWLG